ncbi:MAG: CPBP family intramembrane metalloprotease [bacterium]|nr:CPBP family intramembrane metalloprotease [bacterium]MDI1335505.1 CPBP family intramembrane metalloprotease [Lacunisphaera sp.]
MGQDHPLLLAGLLVAAAITARWWWKDFRAAARGQPNARAFPGVAPASGRLLALAVGGALLLLAIETGGEYALGLSAQQSHMTVLFALYSLAAAFIEELIFRGYLVVEKRGRTALLAGIIGASFGFALLHPFLWEWKRGGLELHLGAKAWFSTALIFAGSLWFYAVRFLPANPGRSLLPCIAAHAAKNLGVFAIKYAQGYVSGWW